MADAGKAAHVRQARQTREHNCHWPECKVQVKPAQWGCKMHWLKLPKSLRDRLWDAYEIGQEESMTPSAEYMKVAHEIQQWIRDNEVL